MTEMKFTSLKSHVSNKTPLFLSEPFFFEWLVSWGSFSWNNTTNTQIIKRSLLIISWRPLFTSSINHSFEIPCGNWGGNGFSMEYMRMNILKYFYQLFFVPFDKWTDSFGTQNPSPIPLQSNSNCSNCSFVQFTSFTFSNDLVYSFISPI